MDPVVLADVVEQMSEFQHASRALLDEIETLVRTLHVSWQGEAATAHAHAHQQWAHGADRMAAALAVLHRAGGHAHSNYTQAISTNEQMWS